VNCFSILAEAPEWASAHFFRFGDLFLAAEGARPLRSSLAGDDLSDMEAADLVETVRALAGRVAGSYALEVFDVQYRRESSGIVLRVLLDRPGPSASAEESVSVEDCARVSRDLSAMLDVDDVVPAATYTLEVSSPGLDRPLRDVRDYQRFAGRRAKLVTREPIGGQTFVRGRLGGVDGADVLVEDDNGRRSRVPMALISRANLEVEF
jgi:ribosome maturation factor RimP